MIDLGRWDQKVVDVRRVVAPSINRLAGGNPAELAQLRRPALQGAQGAAQHFHQLVLAAPDTVMDRVIALREFDEKAIQPPGAGELPNFHNYYRAFHC